MMKSFRKIFQSFHHNENFGWLREVHLVPNVTDLPTQCCSMSKRLLNALPFTFLNIIYHLFILLYIN